MSVSRLQTRIVIAFVTVVCVLQGAAFAVVRMTGDASTRRSLDHELTTGARFFDRLLAKDLNRLEEGARNLAARIELRNAVRSGEADAVMATLLHQVEQGRSDVAMLIDADHHIVADTSTGERRGRLFPLAALLARADTGGVGVTRAVIDGGLYQVAVAPVADASRHAWIAMAFLLDDEHAKAFYQLTGLQVSFYSRTADQPWRLAGTTLPRDAATALISDLDREAEASTREPFRTRLDGVDYMSYLDAQPSIDGSEVVAVLQRPVNEALEPFVSLQRALLIVSGAVLALSLLASLLIARNIAAPIRSLATFARRLAAGANDEVLDIHRQDEIGELANAFREMRQRIMDRERYIAEIAYRDPVTGLPNRALFNDRLRRALITAERSETSVSVVLINLDRFKEINESFGHLAGDELLREVARRIATVARRQGDTIARMGGDEFAVLMPDTEARAGMKLLREIARTLETPLSLAGDSVEIRASGGLATYPEHGTDITTLLRHADAAMYTAKRNGTGIELYDTCYENDSRERRSLMSELRHAIEHDGLSLHYQPKIDLHDRSRLRAEVLLRWQHATRGFVPPDHFIRVAEQTGTITRLTDWVLDASLRQLKAWRDSGVAIDLSINISTRDLTAAAFPTRVLNALARHGCDASWIALEITETSILDDPGQALENLERLHALGCAISIDDFGTGYSSLSYLSKLPVDELKIDKSFVMGMIDHPNDAVIVRSTIEMGHNMGLKVVAEGVETPEVMTALTAMGCDLAQGYLMSRPLPAAELVAWITGSSWLRPVEAEVLRAA